MAVTPSGKDKLTRHMRIYVNGYDLSGDARTFSTLENAFGEADFTGWNEAVRNYLNDGHRMIGISGFQAIMNDDTGRAWDQLKTPDTAGRVSVCFGGGGAPAAGDPAYHLATREMRVPQGFDGPVVVLTADFVADQGQYDSNTNNPLGVVLRGATEISADVTAGSSNSHDNGLSTANGWTAVLHVINTSSGNYTFTIEHSSDDSAYSTLGTFTADGSTVTSEYLTGSGTVNQYVAFNAARTAGSCTVVCTFARGYPVNVAAA